MKEDDATPPGAAEVGEAACDVIGETLGETDVVGVIGVGAGVAGIVGDDVGEDAVGDGTGEEATAGLGVGLIIGAVSAGGLTVFPSPPFVPVPGPVGDRPPNGEEDPKFVDAVGVGVAAGAECKGVGGPL